MKDFETIRYFLHFNNNDEEKMKDEEDYDRLFKVLPIFEMLRFLKVLFEE